MTPFEILRDALACFGAFMLLPTAWIARRLLHNFRIERRRHQARMRIERSIRESIDKAEGVRHG